MATLAQLPLHGNSYSLAAEWSATRRLAAASQTMPPRSPRRRSPPLLLETPASPPTSAAGGAARPQVQSEAEPTRSRPDNQSSSRPSGSRSASSALSPTISASASPTRGDGSAIIPAGTSAPAEREPLQVEHLTGSSAGPPANPLELAQDRRPSAVGFIEPEREQRASSPRGRDRKRSFIGGLGFGGGSSGSTAGTSSSHDGAEAGSFARRSFLSRGVSYGGVDAADSPTGEGPLEASPVGTSSISLAVPPPRKASSAPKRLLRRAKSFGTSPILGGTKDGGFGAAAPSRDSPGLLAPASSPVAPHSTLTTANPHAVASESAYFASASVTASPETSARASPIPSSYSHSGPSTPLTPHSPYLYSHSAASSTHVSANASTMVLPEPIPSQPHWLFAPLALHPPQARRSSEREEQAHSSADCTTTGRRRSTDERSPSASSSSAKGKGRADHRSESVPPLRTPKRKTRRTTLGGLFGRKENKSSAPASAAAEDARRASEGLGGAVVHDLPADSPALEGSAFTDGSPLDAAAAGGTIPSLPSLPSLQLSQNPYRMSWAFGHGSPTSSPEKTLAARAGSEANRLSRPSLSITTTPVSLSPANASPVDEKLSSASPQTASTSMSETQVRPRQTPLLPPPLETTKSSDSAVTLLIRNPTGARAVDEFSSPISPATSGSSIALNRSTLSMSSAPTLRRANSYAPPSSSSSSSRTHPNTPFTRSPLSSPSRELSDPLSVSPAPAYTISSGRAMAASSSPSLARTLIKTRAARSHSDASDRRAPRSTRSPASPVMGGRDLVESGLGITPGGAVFAGAGLKPGEPRPSTADAAAVGSTSSASRSSVFGSLSNFFSSSSSASVSFAAQHDQQRQRGRAASQGMSRSSSAATATSSAGTGDTGGTPASSPGLAGATVRTGAGDVNEFGALFGGVASDRRSSSALTRPGSGRVRGLSVGAGIGSFFGGGSANSTGPAVSLSPSAQNSPTKQLLQQQQHVTGRARSGSASSTGTHGSTGLTPDAASTLSAGGRMRALTDPSRRFSLASFASGSGGLAPPGSSGGRPSTADGAADVSDGTRSRGNSVTSGSTSAASAPFVARVAPRPRKVPPPRLDEGETPEEYVSRLLEGDRRSRRASKVEVNEADCAQEVIEDHQVVAEGAPSEMGRAEELDASEPLPKGEVSRVLASSSDAFHLAALQAYLRLFPFHHLALDIALRLFLSSASLPSETQQIDRVMEAFARRYCECNPGLFGGTPKTREVGDEAISTENGTSDDGRPSLGARRDGQEESDIPYVLAFSMVMLNTDHFNPNAKTKMTKTDYVKNTRIDGVAPEILEYLYDQVSAAPFIYVNDDEPVSSSFSPSASSTSLLGGSIGPSASSVSFGTASSSGFFGSTPSKNRLDPYHLMATGQTHRFKVDVESLIPSKSPFSFTGTTGFFDATKLHILFARAPVLQISNRPRSSSKTQAPQVTAITPYSPAPGYAGSAIPSHLAGAPLTPTLSNGTFIAAPPKKKDRPPLSTLKITKIGLLSRKDDLTEGGKKAASRKWRGWSVILTGSQLLFFKDPHFAGTLQRALHEAAAATEPRPDDHQALVFSWQSSFKPDAVLSLAHSAAIYDSTYSKYRNVFRLVAPGGRQYLFQAHNADELNAWLHAINYAAAFKTAGIRMRAVGQQPPSLSSSQRTSPVPAPPRYGALGGGLSKSTNSHPELPPMPSRLVRSEAFGSLASSGGAVSAKSGLPSEEEDGRTDPGIALAGPHDETLVLPLRSQDALAADVSNGEALRDDDDVPLAELATPRPPDRPFPSQAAPVAPTRAELLRTRIDQLSSEIRTVKEALQGDLRFAKHLSILTPFRHTTRERILTALPPIEKRVRHMRIQLAKLVCYREVLSRDLLVEDREVERLLRKHSLHRSHSRRTSSHHRQRSPTSAHTPQGSPHTNLRSPSRFSALTQSHSSLHPDSAATSDPEHSGRSSFESAAESFSGLVSDVNPLSLTDDELDRLQVRSPPPMQRSKTETDWASLPRSLAPLAQLSLGDHPADTVITRAGADDGQGGDHQSEDELEAREGDGVDTPAKRGSSALWSASDVESPVEESSPPPTTSLRSPPAVLQRHSH